MVTIRALLTRTRGRATPRVGAPGARSRNDARALVLTVAASAPGEWLPGSRLWLPHHTGMCSDLHLCRNPTMLAWHGTATRAPHSRAYVPTYPYPPYPPKPGQPGAAVPCLLLRAVRGFCRCSGTIALCD